jgi:hypothetical membrane protein
MTPVRWAWVAAIAQVVFVVSWLIAQAWQGPRYSALSDTISDMYAVTAPGGLFLVVVLTLCGIATVLFALLSVWPTLRPAGWTAAVGSILLAVSIYGLGDALSPFERQGCRIADPGCTAADQINSLGGRLDSILSTIGIFCFVAAAFFLAAAMRRTPGWERAARPTMWFGVGFLVLVLLLAAVESSGVGGLVERVVVAIGAAAIAALAVRVARTRTTVA